MIRRVGDCLLRTLVAGFQACWGFVRQWSGDAAYDTYRTRAARPLLSRKAFYLESLGRRYRQPNRCC